MSSPSSFVLFRRFLSSKNKVPPPNVPVPLTPKALYKYLLRQVDRIPHPELRKYYKHHIRQSYIQHGDESDPERVGQITKQAVKDCDWVLKKVDLGVEDFDETGSVKGAELEEVRFYNEEGGDGEMTSIPEDLNEALKEPYLKSTLEELKDLEVQKFQTRRILVGHSLMEYGVRETWDLGRLYVLIETEGVVPNKEVPPLRILCSLTKTSSMDDDYVMEIAVCSQAREDSISKLTMQSINYYEDKVAPKIIKWASGNNSLGIERFPNKAPGVPSTSLKYVPVKAYYEEYKRLKETYFGRLQALWTETTDPNKFISEEMGIAAYIKTYITCTEGHATFTFVDLGCGNGVLTFALLACRASGFGIDVRSRRLWEVFPKLGVFTDLRVQSFNPFSDTIKPSENLWLIGNHADELTPWISVMARKFNAQGFVVIPCCLFDFHGKFQRKAKNSSDAESLYQNYIHYIAEVGRKCGYSVKIDKLRIPSTKRVCIVGKTLDDHDVLEAARAYVYSKVSQCPTTDHAISDIQVFKPRSPKEKINNLTQVDKHVVNAIVQRVFETLMDEGEAHDLANHPDYVTLDWNCGRQDLTLPKAAALLSREEKDMIQKQGKGLQTLLKNHNQVFRIKDGYVLLRRPIIDDNQNHNSKTAQELLKKISKIKTQNCYFHFNHKDGCPLSEDKCTFIH